MIKINGFEVGSENRQRLNEITSRLADKDSTLWGAAAQPEAAIRLNWIDLPESSRELLPILDALSAWSRELQHQSFVLCGMGGSSLAPEVIAGVYGKVLTVLDSTDPEHVAAVLGKDLSKSCFVIGSKSGSTIETASQKIAVVSELKKQNLDPKNHIVVVTDPGSPLDQDSKEQGYRVINADPNVGGRFSALSAFGLTPAALIGVDVSVLLDDAAAAAREFRNVDSSVVKVAAALASKEFSIVGFQDRDSQVAGLSEWIEQLIAESTGKDEKGVLPVVLESTLQPKYPVITFNGAGSNDVSATLGEHFIFWEWVTALTCYLLNVDPFNQPNVTEAKNKTSALLKRWSDSTLVEPIPAWESENIAVFTTDELENLNQYLEKAITDCHGYLALMAYLHRGVDDEIAKLRDLLESASGKPTTFGWGPRFLHSTGQFHKGGPKIGSFIQITGAARLDWPIADAGYGFNLLVKAQALGDNEALRERNYPVVRFHLKTRAAGIQELLQAAKTL